jgi:hypothetical protein
VASFLAASFRFNCWTNAPNNFKEEVVQGLTDICSTNKLLFERSAIWPEYCRSLTDLGILERPTGDPEYRIESMTLPSRSSAIELRLYEDYLSTFHNIIKLNITNGWPDSFWVTASTNITSFELLLISTLREDSAATDKRIARIESLRHAVLSVGRNFSSAAVSPDHWQVFTWQIRSKQRSREIILANILKLIQSIRNTMRSKISFSPEKRSGKALITKSAADYLPQLYVSQRNEALRNKRVIFPREAELKIPNLPLQITSFVKKGFFATRENASFNYLAPGADPNKRHHQVKNCWFKSLVASTTISMKRPEKETWRGLIEPPAIKNKVHSLLQVQKLLASICNRETLYLQKIDHNYSRAMLQDKKHTSCPASKNTRFFSNNFLRSNQTAAERATLEALQSMLIDSDCMFLPWRSGVIGGVPFSKILFCSPEFVAKYWPLENSAAWGGVRKSWKSLTFILTNNRMHDTNIFPAPVKREVCPAHWQQKHAQCEHYITRAVKSLSHLTSAYPYLFDSTLDRSLRIMYKWPGKKRTVPTELSSYTRHRRIQRQRVKRGFTIMNILLRSTVGFDTQKAETTLDRVISHGKYLSAEVDTLRNAVTSIIAALKDDAVVDNGEILGGIFEKLANLLDRVLKTQEDWIRDKIALFYRNMENPSFQKRVLIKEADLGIDWNNFYSLQLKEFRSQCNNSNLGLYCSVGTLPGEYTALPPYPATVKTSVDVFRYENTIPNCILAEDMSDSLIAPLGLTNFGSNTSVADIHRLFTGSQFQGRPSYIAQKGSMAMYIDSHMWTENGIVRVDREKIWQLPYEAILFKEKWIPLHTDSHPIRDSYFRTEFGFALKTSAKVNLPIYTCLASTPINFTLEAGYHAMTFSRYNNKDCFKEKQGTNSLYIAPVLSQIESRNPSFDTSFTVWDLPSPLDWDNTILEVLSAIASSHLGRMADRRGRIMNSNMDLRWFNQSVTFFPKETYYPSNRSNNDFGIASFFSELGDSIIESVSFGKRVRAQLNDIMDAQEERFINMTSNMRNKTEEIVSLKAVQYFTAMPESFAIVMTTSSFLFSIALTIYKCRNIRKNKHLLKKIHSKVEKPISSPSLSMPLQPLHTIREEESDSIDYSLDESIEILRKLSRELDTDNGETTPTNYDRMNLAECSFETEQSPSAQCREKEKTEYKQTE